MGSEGNVLVAGWLPGAAEFRGWRDLSAGRIYEQRLIIRFHPAADVTPEQITGYLAELTDQLGMKLIEEPRTSLADEYGWAGWVHWSTSGAHLYAWNAGAPLDRPYVTVDIVTCKAFIDADAMSFTAAYFGVQPGDMVARTM
jgi:hypothetical protein